MTASITSLDEIRKRKKDSIDKDDNIIELSGIDIGLQSHGIYINRPTIFFHLKGSFYTDKTKTTLFEIPDLVEYVKEFPEFGYLYRICLASEDFGALGSKGRWLIAELQEFGYTIDVATYSYSPLWWAQSCDHMILKMNSNAVKSRKNSFLENLLLVSDKDELIFEVSSKEDFEEHISNILYYAPDCMFSFEPINNFPKEELANLILSTPIDNIRMELPSSPFFQEED